MYRCVYIYFVYFSMLESWFCLDWLLCLLLAKQAAQVRLELSQTILIHLNLSSRQGHEKKA